MLFMHHELGNKNLPTKLLSEKINAKMDSRAT